LVGGVEYFHLSAPRRRCQAPPKAICGVIASYGRQIEEMYYKLKNDKLPDQVEEGSCEEEKHNQNKDESRPGRSQGCVYIRQALSITILRAEKASALLKPEDATLPDTRLTIIKDLELDADDE